MNSLELVNKLYKPYRITKKDDCTIIDSTEGKFVIKPKGKKDIKEIYNYLKARDFDNFPEIVDASRSDIDIFEYVEGSVMPKEQKAQDMIKLVAKLHAKTSFVKTVREDKFKEIYENIKENLAYHKDEYNKLISEIEEEVFMSPSHYLFIRNSSKLLSEINFCESKLDDWYKKVEKKRETRVSLVHNNLSLKNYVRGKKEVLLSWENATTDSPILDFYGFYKSEALNLEFKSLLELYLKHYPLDEEELDLLLLMICLPPDIKFTDDEFSSCENVEKVIDYVFMTEELVRPYYLKDDEIE